MTLMAARYALMSGTLTLPDSEPCLRRGVLLIDTGRAGQLAPLADALAELGYPVLRCDGRLASAIQAFYAHVPGLRQLVLWGRQDRASAAALSAIGDCRVAGLVLLDPGGAGLSRWRLQRAMRRFTGPLLLIHSGGTQSALHWPVLRERASVELARLPAPSRAFPAAAWHDAVADIGANWLASW